LSEGNIEAANRLLGYDYSLTGRVVHGRMIGRQIGFPTANIMPDAAKLVPAAGVYKVRVIVESQKSKVESNVGETMALVNIGTNPTVGNTHQTIEVHIPGYDGDLYNQTLTLQFIERLRGEQRFDSLDELREQINKDLQRI
jgi:riboflavin kinase/FMN adenylyltransferase